MTDPSLADISSARLQVIALARNVNDSRPTVTKLNSWG